MQLSPNVEMNNTDTDRKDTHTSYVNNHGIKKKARVPGGRRKKSEIWEKEKGPLQSFP